MLTIYPTLPNCVANRPLPFVVEGIIKKRGGSTSVPCGLASLVVAPPASLSWPRVRIISSVYYIFILVELFYLIRVRGRWTTITNPPRCKAKIIMNSEQKITSRRPPDNRGYPSLKRRVTRGYLPVYAQVNKAFYPLESLENPIFQGLR